MSKDEKIVSDLDARLRQAFIAQTDSQKHLDSVAQALESDIDIDDDLAHRLLQLTLQYRLDKEDVIKKLLRLNNRLCHALGINESNSNKQSLDIAAQLIGKDNLLKELTALGHLWQELNKVLALTEKTRKLQLAERMRRERILSKIKYKSEVKTDPPAVHKEKKITAKERALLYSMKDAIGHQEYFKLNIEQLTEAYHQYAGLPKFGLIFDYLAGLKGPISQFHTALMNGIAKSDAMINSLSNRLKLTPQKLNTKQLLLNINKTLQDNLTLQKNLIRDIQNDKQYWDKLEATLEHQKKEAPHPSKRFDDAMALRRTMNIFNR